MQSKWKTATTAWLTILLVNSVQAGSVIEQQVDQYRAQGANTPNPEQGKALWFSSNGQRSCTSCHGQSPADMGRHAKTRKAIKPMAQTVNPERYTDSKKIEKWFLRNCKWTYGRECTPQEKADFLSWLASQ